MFTSGYASCGFYKKYDIDPYMKILNKPFRLRDASEMVKEALNQVSRREIRVFLYTAQIVK